MTITLTREEAQQVLDALRAVEDLTTHDEEVYAAIDIIEPLLAQPEAKWQELSDYDVDNIVKASSGRESAVYLAEAKLKEKNT